MSRVLTGRAIEPKIAMAAGQAPAAIAASKAREGRGALGALLRQECRATGFGGLSTICHEGSASHKRCQV